MWRRICGDLESGRERQKCWKLKCNLKNKSSSVNIFSSSSCFDTTYIDFSHIQGKKTLAYKFWQLKANLHKSFKLCSFCKNKFILFLNTHNCPFQWREFLLGMHSQYLATLKLLLKAIFLINNDICMVNINSINRNECLNKTQFPHLLLTAVETRCSTFQFSPSFACIFLI